MERERLLWEFELGAARTVEADELRWEELLWEEDVLERWWLPDDDPWWDDSCREWDLWLLGMSLMPNNLEKGLLLRGAVEPCVLDELVDRDDSWRELRAGGGARRDSW